MPTPLQAAVAAYIAAHGDTDGVHLTQIDRLVLMRSRRESLPHHVLYRPTLCVVVQGAKQVMLGDGVFHYGEMQALVINVELPLLGGVTRASADEPFLGIVLDFDVGLMREIMDQLDMPVRPNAATGPCLFVQDVDDRLADCMLRLMRVLETPQAIPILSPSIMREIYYWLLTGPHGGEICKLALPSSHTQRIANAIHAMRGDFGRPIRVEQLAATANMSPTSFHQHFKALTAMTPLQFQKHLRLLEARRLMLADAANATDAAYQVGYESASQFSREYARMFGAPPRRDVVQLRAVPA